MPSAFWRIATCLFALSSSTSALACEPPIWDEDWGPSPVRVAEECAFDRGGPYDGGDITGDPVWSLGNQHTAQVIRDHYACTQGDSLLVVDCTTGNLILIHSVPDRAERASDPSPPPSPVENILRPKGPIRLNKNTTIDKLTKIAKRKGFSFETGPENGYFAGMEEQKQFDPFCGCKLHHPESLGAQQ